MPLVHGSAGSHRLGRPGRRAIQDVVCPGQRRTDAFSASIARRRDRAARNAYRRGPAPLFVEANRRKRSKLPGRLDDGRHKDAIANLDWKKRSERALQRSFDR